MKLFLVNITGLRLGGHVRDKEHRKGRLEVRSMALALIDVCTFGTLFNSYDPLVSPSVNLYQSCFGINTYIKKK